MAINEIVNVKGAEFTIVAECQTVSESGRVITVRMLKSIVECSVGSFYVVTRNDFMQTIGFTHATYDVREAKKEFIEVCANF